jgi:hypothetical protein
MSAAIDTSVVALRSSIKNALDRIMVTVDSKLGATGNFDPTGTGLAATDLAAAVVEIKGLIDALNATYSTDAEMASAIQAVNDAWLAADSNITTLLNNKLDATAYNANATLAQLLTVDGVGSGLDADLLGGLPATDYLTVNDTIDLGEV